MALGGREKTNSELLRQSIARDASAAGACPDPGLLAAYYERSLDATEAERLEEHLSGCWLCREQIAAMVRAEESAIDGAPVPAKPKWARLWDWRWLAPAAAAVLAIALLWSARRPTAKVPEQQPLIAVSQSPAVERNAPWSSHPTYPGSPKTRERLVARDGGPPRSELKKQNASPDEVQNQKVVDSNNPAPAPAPALSRMNPSSQAANEQSAGGIAGSAANGSSSGAAKQQQLALVRPELMTRYSANEKESLQAAYRRNIEIRSPDPEVLWRAAGTGYIARSTDGGITWQAQQPLTDVHLLTGVAVSPSICWIAGRDGIILLTKDGANWATIPPPVHADFVNISARDGSSATVTTADGRRFATQDAGKNWQLAP
jgi:hypothetical protein